MRRPLKFASLVLVVALAASLCTAQVPSLVGRFTNIFLNGNRITSKTVSLNNTQIKALPTTPVTLVPAPGPGLVIRVATVNYSADFSAGAYTNINTTYADLRVEYAAGGEYISGYLVNDSTTVPVLSQMTNAFGSAWKWNTPTIPTMLTFVTTDMSASYVLPQNALYDSTSVGNAAVQLAFDNHGSGNLLTGNVADTLAVTVYYIVEHL